MSTTSSTTLARLRAIAASLPDWLPQAVEPPPDGFREAAVSVVLRASDALDLLLIKRAKSERDPWSGHMALPGGRRDPIDASLLHTAARETLEETAVDLRTAELLGRLEPVAPGGERLPRIAVTPLVFAVGPAVDAAVNSREVASVHWVPLRALLDPASKESTTVHLPDGPRAFPCYRLDGQVVWGLTYRILNRFERHL